MSSELQQPVPQQQPQQSQPQHAPQLPAVVSAAHASSMRWATTEAAIIEHAATSPTAATAASSTPVAAAAASAATTTGEPHVAGLRVSQLDALALDSELGWILSAQLRRACKFLGGDGGGGNWLSDHKAECEALLHAVMFLATLGRDRPTPGMKLQNLHFQNYAALRAISHSQQQPGGSRWRLSSSSSSSWLPASWSLWMARWLGGVSISPSQQQRQSLSIDKIKQLLPSVATAGGGIGSASPRAHPSVALSHFAPSAFPSADSSATSLLNDAATATDSAASALASSAAAASSSSAIAVPAAVLASSLPETAPLVLSRTQKCLYFFGSVVLRYGWTKLNHRMTMEGWGGYPAGDWHRRVYVLCRRLEHTYQALNIINFIAFLHNGHYRTLLERFLSLRLLYVRSRVSRQVSFEFMNQQIAWQALSDFMLFVLPLINFAALGRAAVWVGRTVGLLAPLPSSARARGRRAGEGQHGGGAEEQQGVVGVAEALALGCPYCGLQPACQPTVAHPCGHIFCYYCLSGNRLAEAAEQVARGRRGGAQGALPTEFACPACQRPVTAQAPLNAQVLQPGGTGVAQQQQQQELAHR